MENTKFVIYILRRCIYVSFIQQRNEWTKFNFSKISLGWLLLIGLLRDAELPANFLIKLRNTFRSNLHIQINRATYFTWFTRLPAVKCRLSITPWTDIWWVNKSRRGRPKKPSVVYAILAQELREIDATLGQLSVYAQCTCLLVGFKLSA